MSDSANINPASFVVRDKRYPQAIEYTDFCVDAVNELLTQHPKSFNDICHIITEMMGKTSEELEGKLFDEEKGSTAPNSTGYRYGKFGELRDPSSHYITSLVDGNHYQSWKRYAGRYMRQHFPLRTLGGLAMPPELPDSDNPKDIIIPLCAMAIGGLIRSIPGMRMLQWPEFQHETRVTVKDPRFNVRHENGEETPRTLKLGSIESARIAGEMSTSYYVRVNHSPHKPSFSTGLLFNSYSKNKEQQIEQENSEKRKLTYADKEEEKEINWSYLQQNFMKAIKAGKYFQSTSKQEQVEAAAACYWMISRLPPYYRGTATLSRITLEYMAQEGGFTVPYMQKNVDLNMEAITRPHDEFVQKLSSDIIQGTSYFSDHKATEDKIMVWHKKQAECNTVHAAKR